MRDVPVALVGCRESTCMWLDWLRGMAYRFLTLTATGGKRLRDNERREGLRDEQLDFVVVEQFRKV
jgi:hypothetical protein